MKVFMPFAIKDIGGVATFAEKFSKKLTENKIEVTFTFDWDFDILFIIADCPLSKYFQSLFVAKILKKKIIQRLDGIYTPSSSVGKLYWLYNLKMKIIHDYFADFVVYQSRYSKSAWETICHKKKRCWTIIYNGVDMEKIKPQETDRQRNTPIRLLTFAKFRRRDQIEPLITSVKLLDPKKYSFDIFGSYNDNLKSIFSPLEKSENIHFHGKLPHEKLLEKISKYDIFLFSDQSACPNSVIEAMAAGLPVVAFDRGSIPELMEPGRNGYIAKTEKHNPFLDPYPFTNKSFVEFSRRIEKIVPDLEKYKKNSRLIAEKRFNLEQSSKEYIKIINVL